VNPFNNYHNVVYYNIKMEDQKPVTRFSPVLIVVLILQLLPILGCKMDLGDPASGLTDGQQQLVQELNQQIIPLNGPPLELSDSEVSFLEQVKDARIVGLGEATHGTREFFLMKHRIFQYLVEQHRHKAICFEADFSESIYINAYVTGSDIDLETLMKSVMHFWTWRSEEVKQLLGWMRFYNSGKPASEQILYFGIDCQHTTFQPGLLESYFLRTHPQLQQSAQPLLIEIRNFVGDDYRSMSVAQYQIYLDRLETLTAQMEAYKTLLVQASGNGEYELYKQVLRTFQQAFIMRYHLETGYGDNLRDHFMAENALWIADFLGSDSKISLWAHNGHIAVDPVYIDSGSMGYRLTQNTSPDNYRAIGFGFSMGTFSAQTEEADGRFTDVAVHEITDEPLPDSVNYLWHQAADRNFVFRTGDFTGGSGWNEWLKSDHPYLMIGKSYNGKPENYYRPTDIGNHFHIIIYFDTTNATQLIDN